MEIHDDAADVGPTGRSYLAFRFNRATSFDQNLGWTTTASGANDMDTYRDAPCAYCKCGVNDVCQTKNDFGTNDFGTNDFGTNDFGTAGLATPSPTPSNSSNEPSSAPTESGTGGSDAATRSGALLAGALSLLAFAL
jgi:hypothetical protein